MAAATPSCHPELVEGRRAEHPNTSTSSCFDKLSMTMTNRARALLFFCDLNYAGKR
jgi:hypothetical protein